MAWGSQSKTDVDKLERVLWRPVKMTEGRLDHKTCEERPEELGLFSLEKGKLWERGKSNHSLPQHRGELQRR